MRSYMLPEMSWLPPATIVSAQSLGSPAWAIEGALVLATLNTISAPDHCHLCGCQRAKSCPHAVWCEVGLRLCCRE